MGDHGGPHIGCGQTDFLFFLILCRLGCRSQFGCRFFLFLTVVVFPAFFLGGRTGHS